MHQAVHFRSQVTIYACAADELEKGLLLNQTWKDAAEHRQFQENFCESLRNLQDRQSGDTAAQTLKRFVTAAEGLNQLAPDSVPAVYYLAKAHRLQVQPMLIDINPTNRPSVSKQLGDTASAVKSTMESAQSGTLPEWNRFADNYRRLSIDLSNLMQAAQCP